MPCGRRLSTLLKAKSGREGRRWHHLCQLDEKLGHVARSNNQVVEVFHLIDGEDSRRRMLCPWRAHPLASTLPAVARATAGRFVRYEWLVGRGVCALRDSSSGSCVGRSPRRVSLEIGGPAAVSGTVAGTPTTDGQPCGEQLTQKPRAEPLRTHATRPTSHSHRMKRPAVARATAGKVLARGCARQGQSTRRRLSSPPTTWNTSATWLVDRAAWQSSSSSCRSWHQPRPSRPDLALSSGDSLRPQGAQG